jgi:hypothetical protein
VPLVRGNDGILGGVHGIALLRHIRSGGQNEQLTDYVNNRVFANFTGSCLSPVKADVDGFMTFMENFKAGLAIEKCAASLNLK